SSRLDVVAAGTTHSRGVLLLDGPPASFASRSCNFSRSIVGGGFLDLRYDRPDELAAARLLDIDGQALLRVIVLKKVRAVRGGLEFGIARLVAGSAAAVAVWRELQLMTSAPSSAIIRVQVGPATN